MKKKISKKTVFTVSICVLVIVGLVGYYIPIDSYTTFGDCPTIGIRRLHFIFGDSLDDIKKDDDIHRKNYRPPGPTEGCSPSENYKLFIF